MAGQATGNAYRENRRSTIDPDKSKYPKHVPTVREQLEGSRSKTDPDEITKSQLERMTAIGVLANPLTLRSHYEDEYEADSIRERMRNWGQTPDESETGEWATVAHERYGEDHSQTVYPSEAREE